MPEPTPRCTRLCDLVGVRYPIVQTGMGWVAGPAAGGRHRQRRGPRHPGVGDDDPRRAGRRRWPRCGRVPTRPSASTCGPTPRTRPADRPARRGRGEGGELRPGAPARHGGTLREAGVVVIPTVGARRHAEKVAEWGVHGVIAQGAEGGGHTGPVPTSLLLPQVLTPWATGWRSSARAGSRAVGVSSPPSPTGRRASPWGRAFSSPGRAPSPTR